MVQMSFSEKLKILADVSSSSGICIASIFLLVFVGALFLTTNKKNAKSSKKLYLSIYILLIIIILIQYHSSLSDMYEYMMNNFFIVFYFPNLAIYLAAVIATNIILWVTIFNFKEDKILKFINTTVYCMIHYLLVLILNIVTKNKLDVFDQSSVYKNTDASALISLSSIIFVVWIIFMIIYKIIRQNQRKNQKEKVPVKRIIRYKKMLPSNYQSINIPTKLVGKPGKSRPQGVYVDSNLIDFYKQPKEVNILKEYEAMFTLEDYRKMLELLKENDKKIVKKDSKNTKKPVVQEQLSLNFEPIEEEKEEFVEEKIDDTSDTKVEDYIKIELEEATELEEEVPQPKLEELLNLYRSV